MLQFFIIKFLLVFIYKGTRCQQITFDYPKLMTPCVKDLRAGMDHFIISATVKDYVAQTGYGWETSVNFEILSPLESRFRLVCNVPIGGDFSRCGGAITNSTCFCNQAIGGAAKVLLFHRADLNFSQLIFRGYWQHRIGQIVYSLNNITFPSVYDVKKAALRLVVSGHPAIILNKTSESCRVGLKPDIFSTIELCCSKAASPCYPRISFDGLVVADGQEKCIKHTFVPSKENNTINVTLSYSVCSLSDYIIKYSCLLVKNVTGKKEQPDTECHKIGYCYIRLSVGVTYPLTFIILIIVIWIVYSHRPGSVCYENNDLKLMLALGVAFPLLCIAFFIVIIYLPEWWKEQRECPGQEDYCKIKLALGIGIPLTCDAVAFAFLFVWLWYHGKQAVSERSSTPMMDRASKAISRKSAWNYQGMRSASLRSGETLIE